MRLPGLGLYFKILILETMVLGGSLPGQGLYCKILSLQPGA